MTRILVLNFFPAFVPPSSGGELRYFHLYSHLSKHFDITLVSPTYSHHPRELITHSETFREHRIPKEPLHDNLHAEIGALGLAEEISALVCSLSAGYPNQYHQAYLGLQSSADLIVHESPYMLDYDLLLGLDGRPRIYNSYNLEADLVSQMWRGPAAPRYLAHITNLESRLLAESDLCFAVSETEAERFCAKYGLAPERLSIAENGIAPEEFLPRLPNVDARAFALFFGSFHPPNIAAAQFIIKHLAPTLPGLDFVIAGSCVPVDTPGLPDNVRTLGRVDNEQRLKLFATATIALNPMFTGSGTNLKALEYLAAGIPLVTTPLGSRGLQILHQDHALVAPPEHFPLAIRRLLADPTLAQRLASAGRDHVIARFSWGAISRRTAESIDRLLSARRKPRRGRILLLNDFSVSNATSGGEVRINRIYSALARHYDVTHVCLTQATALRRLEIAPHFIELQIPKTETHRQADVNYAWHVSANDITTYRHAPLNPLLVDLVKALCEYCDVVVLCHPYMVGLLRSLERRPIIYEALNVETTLKKSLLLGHPAYDELITAAEECERAAIAKSDEIVLVADSDQADITALGGRDGHMHIVLNGVDVPTQPVNSHDLDHIRQSLRKRSIAVFIASAHPPNVEAARHIVESLAPQMPDLLFALVGAVCEALPPSLPRNVLLFGRLEDATKDVVIELADIALNPMVAGSGSNLKLAEYFSKSRPTITTPFGARGYAIKAKEHAIICSLAEFPGQIRLLLSDPELCRYIGANAYNFARTNLAWSLQAERFHQLLKRSVFHPARRKPRLLIVTYRFTDPPMGGAEAYLLQLVRQLDKKRDFYIDIATTTTGRLQNQYHFSCCFEPDANPHPPADLANVRVFRFPVDESSERHRLDDCRRLWHVWNEEFRRASLLHLDKLPDAVLLGGWYYPEHSQDGVIIWSSQSALIRTKNVDELLLYGYSPQSNELTVSSEGRVLFSTVVNGPFQITVTTHGADLIQLQLKLPYIASGDPRSLGILVRKILCNSPHGSEPLRLDLNYRDLLRRVAPTEFIQDLVAIAEARSPSDDALFQETRGPNSQALEAWLAGNASAYDIVVGHSVPFKTALMAANTASSAGIPLVQLPHFHIDDEFYHWASYYAALRKADVCLTFPKTATPLFFDPIGARSFYVSHGPVSEGHPSPDEERIFDELYRSSLPFVLILGRKDRAKRYSITINAVDRLNNGNRRCNVLMIGRDEDQEPVDSSKVLYLGEQPGGIVLAALRRCVCLVSMSESESFGIVVLEAWAQGRPVIVSDGCAASVELVTDGQNGLLANASNLHDRILTMLARSDEADRMGKNGKMKLAAEFTWDAIGTRVNNVLLDLLTARTSRLPTDQFTEYHRTESDLKDALIRRSGRRQTAL